ETLLNREELVHAEDLKEYFRVPSDTRDLNYGKYFEVGESKLSLEHDYTSGNTRQLTQQELIEMLLKLDYIQHELAADRRQPADEGF
ncbi:MAG: UDP-glucose 4-epimerase, partial [Verrucomicrobia bacterium]|nr:UDP-glucose 4-epimerase [Verrucomicrobiota bacterium]